MIGYKGKDLLHALMQRHITDAEMMAVKNIEILGDARQRCGQFMIRSAGIKFERHIAGEEEMVVVGGALEGDILDVDRIKELAALPSLDELRAQFVSLIQTPATRIAGVVQAPATQLARVLNAYAEKSEAA